MRCFLIALALCPVGLVGCGGGKDTGSDADSGGTTKAEFVAAGDAICEDVNRVVDDVNDRLQRIESGATSPDEVFARARKLLSRAYGVQREANEEFKDLDVPAGDQGVVDQIHEAHDQGVALLGRMVDATKRQDAQAMSALSQDLTRVSEKARALERGYGFKACGREPQ